MRKCKKIKDLMPDALNDNNVLPQAELRKLREHLKDCQRCSEEYKKLAALLAVMNKRQRPQMSDAFWENYSLRLEEKLDAAEEVKEQKSPAKIFNLIDWLDGFDFKIRWVLYPLTAAAILVVGIAIGLYLSHQPGKDIMNTAVSSLRRLSPAVAEHFDNVLPLLLDYSNSSPQQTGNSPEENILVEKSTVKKLLLENQLLKRVMTKNNNISVNELMNELELILLELSNDSGDSEETRRAVQRFIKENNVLFKMKTLEKKDKQTLAI
ncbi:MAG: zf-HC2 protein [Acidobacteriota bacterium]|nr:zf-HC2 protein [Acidobacteriota bacterium]